MDWQQAVALAIVAATALAFARAHWRRRRGFDFIRDTPCGCVGKGQTQAQGSIIFQARKGERARVVVKMK